MKNIIIVEDNMSFAATVQKIIGLESDMKCMYHAINGGEALDILPEYNADVCLLDIQLPDMTGIDVLKQIKSKCVHTIFIMCTVYDDNEHLFQSLKAGADGYILKSDSPMQIIEAIRASINGAAPMSASIAKKVINFFYDEAQKKKKIEDLTEKENEILHHLSQGFLYKEIAEKQSVTIDTIKKHCGNIYRKLQVCNRTEALNLYFNH
jgi:two-component system, NarL family, response regulator LiaR